MSVQISLLVFYFMSYVYILQCLYLTNRPFYPKTFSIHYEKKLLLTALQNKPQKLFFSTWNCSVVLFASQEKFVFVKLIQQEIILCYHTRRDFGVKLLLPSIRDHWPFSSNRYRIPAIGTNRRRKVIGSVVRWKAGETAHVKITEG